MRPQGVMFSAPETILDSITMKRLWVHEILRVYYDRLVENSDRSWFFETIHSVCKNILNEEMNDMFSHLANDNNEVQS